MKPETDDIASVIDHALLAVTLTTCDLDAGCRLAVGGIHTLDTLLALHAAGADRIGTSRTADILNACQRSG